VTASNVQPPASSTTRLTQLVILAFIYVTLCILPNTALVSIVHACEIVAARKTAGDSKPFFIPFVRLTADNFKKIQQRVEHVNTFFRILLALVFIAFVAPIFTSPSYVPPQALILGDLAFSDGVDSYVSSQGVLTTAMYAGVIGTALVLIGIGFFTDYVQYRDLQAMSSMD
jgi:hypothetical protein